MNVLTDRDNPLLIEARTDTILDALRVNREKHVSEFEETQKGFVKAASKLLKKVLKKYQEDGCTKDLYVQLTAPVNNEEVYITAIQSLELHQAAGKETISLNAGQVRSLVHDEWNWTNQVTASKAQYLGGA